MQSENSDTQNRWEHVFDTDGKKKIKINNRLKTIVSVIKDKTKIVDITLGDGISAIEDNCFGGFTSLSSVNGGKNCQRIGDSAFENCSSLVNCDMVNDGTTVTFIGNSAFRNTSVTMLRSSMIPQNGFENCKNLKEISLPDSTSFVYDGCFKNCKSIEKFTFPSKIWGIGANMF